MIRTNTTHLSTQLHSSIHSSPSPHHSQPTHASDPRSPTVILSPASLQNHILGDPITSKHPDSIRFVLQNPNGISTNESCFEYQLCLHQMNSVFADIILLPETNLLWKDYTIFNATTNYHRNLFTHSRQNTSFSSRHYDSPYQPGGTCSILANGIVGHYHSSTHDSILGRWNIINLNISGGRVLSIICCYQTCHNSPQNAGPKTFYMQQWSLLRDKEIPNPNP